MTRFKINGNINKEEKLCSRYSYMVSDRNGQGNGYVIAELLLCSESGKHFQDYNQSIQTDGNPISEREAKYDRLYPVTAPL